MLLSAHIVKNYTYMFVMHMLLNTYTKQGRAFETDLSRAAFRLRNTNVSLLAASKKAGHGTLNDSMKSAESDASVLLLGRKWKS